MSWAKPLSGETPTNWRLPMAWYGTENGGRTPVPRVDDAEIDPWCSVDYTAIAAKMGALGPHEVRLWVPHFAFPPVPLGDPDASNHVPS